MSSRPLAWLLLFSGAAACGAVNPARVPPGLVHATVRAPVPDGIDLSVPAELGNQELARLGYVDVTAAPFGADNTGRTDATAALQAAVDFARDHQMACFLPLGTYRISDTLHLIQNYYRRANGTIAAAPNVPCTLVGSAKVPGRRPTLLLAPHAAGFNDPAHRKFVVDVTDRGVKTGGVDVPQANVSFRQFLCHFNITIGEGNAGAVGLHMQAAEGSTAQDITIDATHGFIGLQGGAGSGGSHHNITVIGGRIGIDTHGAPPEFSADGPGTQPTPTFAHVTLIGQTETAISNYSRGPAIWVGLRIETDTAGPVIVGDGRNAQAPLNGSLAFIDSEIVFHHPSDGNRVVRSERSVYFNNVYVEHAGLLVNDVRAPAGVEWARVVQLAVPVNPPPAGPHAVAFDESPLIDGQRAAAPYVIVEPGVAPPPELTERHIWPDTFPTFETPGAVSVKDPPFGAKGDSNADDTAALQQAIDHAEVVFLPKGYYRVTRPLHLRPNTKLIGVAQHLSSILLRDPGPAFSAPARPAALVETADDPEAETYLAFLGLMVPYDPPGTYAHDQRTGYYALKWMSGRRSICRSVQFQFFRLGGFTSRSGDEFPVLGGTDIARRTAEASIVSRNTPVVGQSLVLITGNGGGKWYNFHHTWAHNARTAPGVRNILVRGTHEPLAFYHLSPQIYNYDLAEVRYRAPYSIEFEGASNIDVFGVKTEHRVSFALVRDCRNVRFFGHGGAGQPENGTWQYRFERCADLLVSNVGDQVYLGEPRADKRFVLDEFTPIMDVYKGAAHPVPSRARPVVYLRGNPAGAFGQDWPTVTSMAGPHATPSTAL